MTSPIIMLLTKRPDLLTDEQLRQLGNEVHSRLLVQPRIELLKDVLMLVEHEQIYRGYFQKVYHGCRRPWHMLLADDAPTF